MARWAVLILAASASLTLATPAGAATAAGAVDPADLAIAVTDSPDPSGPGGTITYMITFGNSGPGNADRPVMTATTPANTVFASFATPPHWTVTTPPVGAAGTVTATGALVTPREGASFKLTVLVTGGDRIDLSASVGSDAPDPDPGNNTATAATELSNAADLRVAVADSPGAVAAGTPVTYQITLTDAGPAAAAAAELSVETPANTVFTSFTAPDGWTVTNPPVGGTGRVRATAASVQPGGPGPAFTLTVTLAPGTAHGVQLRLKPSVTSATPDPDGGNNSVTAAVTVANAGDLTVSVTDSPDPVVAGGAVAYALTLTNNGPVAATNAALSADLPAGTTFSSFTAPAGWTTSAPAPGAATGAVSVTLATLPSGGSATFTLVLTAGSTSQVRLTATTSATTTDPTPANNSETVSTTVTAGTASPAPGAAGGPTRGGLAMTGSSVVRLVGITAVLLGLGILFVAMGRSRRSRRRYGR